jgi:DNA polymerase III delta prime subunit
MSLTGGRKVIIIDEADYLNATSTQPALRNAMEDFSSNCTFIFTCNYPAKIIPALHSRCATIQFNLQAQEKVSMAGLFFKSVTGILKNENIPFDKEVIAEVVKRFFPDFRRTINQLQWYSRFGKIDSGILSQVNNSSIEEVVKYVKDKDFKAMRKWVATNDIDVVSIFRQLYECFGETMMPASIPQAVIILADYQYKQAFVADSEINLVACLTELMGSCEFN